MTVLEALRQGRERIAKGWCQNTEARTANGEPCADTDPRAAGWCLLGALPTLGYPGAAWALRGDSSVSAAGSMVDWNDAPGRTQAEVLDLYDRTIARLEREAENEDEAPDNEEEFPSEEELAR